MNFNISSNTFFPFSTSKGRNLFTKRHSRCLHSDPQSLSLALFSYQNFSLETMPSIFALLFHLCYVFIYELFFTSYSVQSSWGIAKKNIIPQFHSSFFFSIQIDYFPPTLRLCKNIIRGHRCTSLCNFNLNIPNIHTSDERANE